MALIEIAAGFLIIMIYQSFPLRYAKWIGGVFLPVAVFAASYIAFQSFSWWVGVLPMVLGVYVDQYRLQLERQRSQVKHAGGRVLLENKLRRLTRRVTTQQSVEIVSEDEKQTGR